MEGGDAMVILGGVCRGVVMVHLMERAVWGHRGTLVIFNCLLGETQNNPCVWPKRALNPPVLPPPQPPRQVTMLHCPPHTNLHCKWCLQIPAQTPGTRKAAQVPPDHPQPFWDPSNELKRLPGACSKDRGAQTTPPPASGPHVPKSLRLQAQQQLWMRRMIWDGPDSPSSPASDPRRRCFLP